mmetsp:Transcript_14244/g.46489  ORF Transcript_14244/g.46489 Transcript_14244/m.46489 type:complete len:399 (-) Transcript_14244:98-1294(-)
MARNHHHCALPFFAATLQMVIKAVSLDFDDTLVRSEEVKRRVLVEVASAYGGEGALGSVKTDAREAGAKKVTRYTIFREVASALGREDGREMAEEYGRRVEAALRSAAEVDGATELLEELRLRGVPTFVNSATPQAALERAVRWAVPAFGSPEEGGDKVDALRRIADRVRCEPCEVVHVGDGRNDLDAARRFGCRFLGVNFPDKDDDVESVKDMRGAAVVLRRMLATRCRICDKNFSETFSGGQRTSSNSSSSSPQKGQTPVVIWSSRRWLLCHASLPAPIAGWCMLHTKRHVASPADFDDDEAAEFGPVLRRVQAALLAATDAPRIYACAMAETSPHFHMHLVPRPPDLDDDLRGFALFRLQAAAKADPALAVPEADVLDVKAKLGRALREDPPPAS